MKHLTIAIILTLVGLVPQAYAQQRDDSTEAASADEMECTQGTCMTQVARNKSFVQKSDESSMQEVDYAMGRRSGSTFSPGTGQ